MQRPLTSEIAKELLTMSQREGLTHSKAEKLELTRTLPAVEASMLHNHRHPDDRDAVALEYVECVARSHHLLGETTSRLVCMSLNIDPISDMGLDARINVYMGQQYIQERDTYNNHRDKAFARLAGRLVALNHSPCDVAADQEQEERVRIEGEFRAAYDKQTFAQLEQVWHRIEFTHSEENREEALRKMIEMLPGIAARVRDGAVTSYELVKAMMRRILQTEYPRWLTVLQFERAYLPAESLLNALDFLGRFDGDTSLMVKRRNSEVEISIIPPSGEGTRSSREPDRVPMEGLFERVDGDSTGLVRFRLTEQRIKIVQVELERSYRFALEIMLRVEEAGGWSWIPGPEKMPAVVERPLSYV